MNTLLAVEIAVNLFLQGLGGWLAAPMKLFSFLGQEEFFLLLLPALYWCIDSGLGLRVGVILLSSNAINCFFKILLHGPRPYWFDTRVRALASETSFGIPSGHSQMAAGIWGLLAVSNRRKWGVFAALAVIFFIGLSRLYLGVHFLTDVLAGWLLGGLTLVLFVYLEPPVTAWIKQRSLGQQIGLAALSSLGLILFQSLAFATSPGYVLPAEWIQNSAAAAPGVTINPFDISGFFTVAGTWFGMLGGAAWLWKKRGPFDAGGPGSHRLLRYAIGAIGVLVLWYGLGAVFPRTATVLAYLLRYFRYILIGLWVSVLGPLVFARLGIAQFKAPLPEPKPVAVEKVAATD